MADTAREKHGVGWAGAAIAEPPSLDALAELAGTPLHLALHGLRAGYGHMEVLHGVDLMVGRGQSLCIIGPNGSGKSTVLNALFGLAEVMDGRMEVAGRDVTGISAESMLLDARIGYVLQAGSIFLDMTVEENLLMGGHVLKSQRRAALAVERIFDAHPRLAERRKDCAGVLSGGERRMLELARALITEPEILLIDEPTIGLEPRMIDAAFETLDRLQRVEGKTILMVEQNAKKGLEFADLGYVLAAGRVALAGRSAELLHDPQVARLFLGG